GRRISADRHVRDVEQPFRPPVVRKAAKQLLIEGDRVSRSLLLCVMQLAEDADAGARAQIAVLLLTETQVRDAEEVEERFVLRCRGVDGQAGCLSQPLELGDRFPSLSRQQMLPGEGESISESRLASALNDDT